MLTDENVFDLVRGELAAELADVTLVPQLLTSVRRRHAQRVRVRVTAVVVVALAAAVSIVVPLAGSGGGAPSSSTGSHRSGRVTLNGSAVSLAGYETNLPAGYTFTEGTTGTQCSNFFVPVGVMPASGTPAPSPQDFSQLWLHAPRGPGCLAFGLSASYKPTPDSSVDPVAPVGSQATTIGAYRASTYQAPNSSTRAVYVVIPTGSGLHHDLIVAAEGITQADLVAMVRKALPTPATPAPASTGSSSGSSSSTSTSTW